MTAPARASRRHMMLGRAASRRLADVATYLVLILGTAIIMIPPFWMLSASLKTVDKIFIFPPEWIPRPFTLDNYIRMFRDVPFPRFFLNSVIVSSCTIVGQTLSASIVGFGFARLRFPGRNIIFVIMLSTLMIPFQVTMIPLFVIMRWLGFLNSLKALIVPAFFGSPFYIFLMRQYFMTLPFELDDAARIDGCNTFQIFWRIILPLASPALASVVVLEFLASWNSFVGPLIFLNDQNKYTVSLGLSMFRNAFQTDWGGLMAASVLTTLPALIVFFLAQQKLIGGIALTGIKG
jgi:ABC-type glycerol-3-phosphate transport system permease component